MKFNFSDIDTNDEESLEVLDERLKDYIKATPPSCLRKVEAVPMDLSKLSRRKFSAAYQLKCRCGGGNGAILGYPLRDYKPKYRGHEFLSPLAFRCSSCGKVNEFFDTDKHGYHVEVGKLEGDKGSTKIRGTGKRTQFYCPKCAKDFFTLAVGFVYWDFYFFHEELEMIADGDGEEAVFAHPQDFYNEILIQATCDDCHQTTTVSDFGKL